MQCSKARTEKDGEDKSSTLHSVVLQSQVALAVMCGCCGDPFLISLLQGGGTYTTEAILLSAAALSDANCSRLKPWQAWMQDCRAEVSSSLIKGRDRIPKLGTATEGSCAVLLPPATSGCASCSSWWSIRDKLMALSAVAAQFHSAK